LLTRHIGFLRIAVLTVRRASPFKIDAWVVLPDHLHCVWTLPPEDDDFSTRWRLIKTIFARSLPPDE
jgi:putative transposase